MLCNTLFKVHRDYVLSYIRYTYWPERITSYLKKQNSSLYLDILRKYFSLNNFNFLRHNLATAPELVSFELASENCRQRTLGTRLPSVEIAGKNINDSVSLARLDF